MAKIPMSAVQIADDIAERIRRGEYPPATKLPSGPELADLYDTSLSTAHRVFLILRERGVVVGRQGKGVYVNEASPAQGHGSSRRRRA
jgi:GntR family transcriptional regulator